jgi:Tfp pilus assembly protein PilF
MSRPTLEDCPRILEEAAQLSSADPARAIQLYTEVHQAYKAARKNRDEAEVLSRLAALYMSIGQPEPAKAHYKLAYGADPSNPVILARYGDFLYITKEVAEASKIFRAILLIPPGENPPLEKAEIYLRLGGLAQLESPPNKQRALDMYRRGLMFSPENQALQQAIEALTS